MTEIIPQFVQGELFDFGEPEVPMKHCDQCDRDLPETAEYWHRRGNKFRLPCKSCRHDNEYLPHASEIIAKQREAFLAMSPEEQEQARDRWNTQYRDRSVKKRQQGLCSRCLEHPATTGHLCDTCQADQKRYGDELRDQVLAAYGGKCVVCGESHPAFLAIDHINDDGADHRRTIGGGHRLYRWLRKKGFPDGFQLLCTNCNWIKRLKLSGEKTYIRQWRDKLRQETLAAYGCICSCCGEDRQEVLTIDHVNNDGAEHRRQVGAGAAFYAWLRKNGFPQDGRYQILCFSCNHAKFVYGVCPHQQ